MERDSQEEMAASEKRFLHGGSLEGKTETRTDLLAIDISTFSPNQGFQQAVTQLITHYNIKNPNQFSVPPLSAEFFGLLGGYAILYFLLHFLTTFFGHPRK